MARTSRRRELKSNQHCSITGRIVGTVADIWATAPIISQSVEVELPDAIDTQTVSSSDNPPIILEVSGLANNMRLDGEVLELLPPEQIAARSKISIRENPKAFS